MKAKIEPKQQTLVLHINILQAIYGTIADKINLELIVCQNTITNKYKIFT